MITEEQTEQQEEQEQLANIDPISGEPWFI